MDKVSDLLDDEQKHLFIRNLLQQMRRDETIAIKEGKTRGAKWILTKKFQKKK